MSTSDTSFSESVPLLEFDPDPGAMIEPSAHFGVAPGTRPDMPELGVACFWLYAN